MLYAVFIQFIMNLDLFIKALNEEEKMQLFQTLAKEIIKEPKKEVFTTVENFCRNVKMSTRLRNVLLANKNWLGGYIETIDSSQIHKCRNASMKTESEFILVRGY